MGIIYQNYIIFQMDLKKNLLRKIKYINSKNIIHRDIKPENIVWGFVNNSKIKKNELFIIDFGFGISFDKKINPIWKRMGGLVLQDICQ